VRRREADFAGLEGSGLMRKMFFVDVDKCTGCRICEVACSLEHGGSINPARARIHIMKMDERGVDVPVVCQHCETPLCLDVCPMNAISRDEPSGAVLVDVDRCVGCAACTLVCPYGAVIIDVETKKSAKCDLCEGDPKCVQVCPKSALLFAETSVVNSLRRRQKMDTLLRLLADRTEN
jgi:anaerobic carbon-monoxide dehydrogenase iron sulfur subunit